MSVTCELGLYLCSQMGLSPVVYGDIVLSINTQYKKIQYNNLAEGGDKLSLNIFNLASCHLAPLSFD